MRRAASSAGVTRDASSAKRRPMPPRRASSRVPVAGGKLGAITAAVETVSARCGGKEGSARGDESGGLAREGRTHRRRGTVARQLSFRTRGVRGRRDAP